MAAPTINIDVYGDALLVLATAGIVVPIVQRWRISPVLGYLSESSYWVYLVHFPLCIAFASLLYVADMPGVVKMLLVIGATTAVCLASYHLVVRFTWVSVLLNGKRHERPQAPPALTPA